MGQSVYGSILATGAAQIAGLGLTYNGAALPVSVRKLPKAEKGIDTPLAVPLIAVAPHEDPESIEPFTTEDVVLVKYVAEVMLIAAGNSNFTDTNLDLWLRFREQTRRIFQFGIVGIALPGGADLFFAEVIPEAPLDREGLDKNYEMSGLGFRFWVAEQRTN